MSESYSYVGVRPCGCAVAACVDEPQYRKENAKSLKQWMLDGMTIERWTTARVRTDLKSCHCK